MNYLSENIIFDKPSKKRIATDDEYGIILVKKGNIHVNGEWNLTADDILVCKPYQVLKLEHTSAKYPKNIIWLKLSTSLMNMLSTEQTNIVASFEINPAPIAILRGQSELLMLIKSLAIQMMSLPNKRDKYAADLLEESTLKMFIALVLKFCISSDLHTVKKTRNLTLDDVFQYIHSHLSEDLSLEQLEKEFYISRHHLIRLFKQKTGQTVHQYILKARLDLCKSYIEQGYSIIEVYKMGGFGGYNHFFRAFKKEYNMTPKDYYKKHSQNKI